MLSLCTSNRLHIILLIARSHILYIYTYIHIYISHDEHSKGQAVALQALQVVVAGVCPSLAVPRPAHQIVLIDRASLPLMLLWLLRTKPCNNQLVYNWTPRLQGQCVLDAWGSFFAPGSGG